MIAFHTSDTDVTAGSAVSFTEWWGHEVDLVFRYLDPSGEVALLAEAGLSLTARLDRAPHPGSEHPSHRSYLLVTAP